MQNDGLGLFPFGVAERLRLSVAARSCTKEIFCFITSITLATLLNMSSLELVTLTRPSVTLALSGREIWDKYF